MSEAPTPAPVLPPADPQRVASTLVIYALCELSPKARRRLIKVWRELGEGLAAKADDAGNVYPIDGGGLPSHLTPRALEMAAVGRVILASVSDQKGG